MFGTAVCFFEKQLLVFVVVGVERVGIFGLVLCLTAGLARELYRAIHELTAKMVSKKQIIVGDIFLVV